MKKITLLLSFISLTFWGCKAQTNEQEKIESNQNQPQITTKVDKEYDENGNLIRYDSLYTYTYSSGNLSPQELDSIFNAFFSEFNRQFPEFNQPLLPLPSQPDSLFFKSFFSPHFFTKQFMQQDSLLLQMMQEMDRFKNEFYFPENKK